MRSTAKLVAWRLIPLGPLAAGLLITAVHAGPTLLLLSGAMLLVAVASTFSRGMRRIGDPADSDA